MTPTARTPDEILAVMHGAVTAFDRGIISFPEIAYEIERGIDWEGMPWEWRGDLVSRALASRPVIEAHVRHSLGDPVPLADLIGRAIAVLLEQPWLCVYERSELTDMVIGFDDPTTTANLLALLGRMGNTGEYVTRLLRRDPDAFG